VRIGVDERGAAGVVTSFSRDGNERKSYGPR
jgi:hypothetical protein